ncbi:MAG: hypothetical protein GX446_07225 [Chthonomonadales bacterium]|nr:hypothetical protein [Chthonomonadales bacterium]
MTWMRRLRAAARLLVDWDVFKHALDDALGDECVRRRVEVILASEPLLAAHVAALKALWTPVEADLKELR